MSPHLAELLPRTEAGRYLAPARTPVDPHELYALWAVARAEANLAYDGWSAAPGRETYAAYRAAEDRADAAQDALALVAA